MKKMLEKLIRKYPCLWDNTDPEFRNISYKSHCRDLVLKEINSTSIPPFSMALLRTKIRSFGRRIRRARQRCKNRDSSPIGESDDGVDDDESIYERDVAPSPISAKDDGDETVAGSSGGHEWYRCDVCHSDIVGFRYTCVQCSGWELCAACEARGEHPAHYVLRVPLGQTRLDVKVVLKQIRDQLLFEDTAISINNGAKTKQMEQDPLKESHGAPPHHQGYQDIFFEENEDSVALKYLDLNKKGGNQPINKVQSYRPKVQSHQYKVESHQPIVQSHQPEMQSQDLLVIRQRKRPYTYEGSRPESACAAFERDKGSFAVYTHRADYGGCHNAASPSSKVSVPPRTKRKR